MRTSTLARIIGGLCALLVVVLGPQGVRAQSGDTVAVYTGADFKEDSWFAYGGGIFAFNGLDAEGVVLRAFVGGGEFEFDAVLPFPNSLEHESDAITFNTLAGYQVVFDGVKAAAYAGVSYWDVDQGLANPGFGPGFPPNVKVNGDEFGFMIAGEVTHHGVAPFYLDARGEYSTAFDTYWARARVGYDAGVVVIGPEGTALGNEDFDQLRIGGFVEFLLFETGVIVSLSAGYADVDGVTGEDSAYGTVNLATTF